MKGTVNVKDLPKKIQEDIMNHFLENERQWTSLKKMPVEEALHAFLEWNGIIGYDEAINAIFEAGQRT